MDLFNNLNPEQLAGVQATHGPVLVIAGAGSGKTKMLTSRIANLVLNHHVPAENILAVTFTNKAAQEMRNRVMKILNGSGESQDVPEGFNSPNWGFFNTNLISVPLIGTFHSICCQILRREIDRTPYTQQFNIYDDSDQLSLIKECFAKLGLSDKVFSPKGFQYAINTAKCWVQNPTEVSGYGKKELQAVYELYQEALYRNNAIDFGEIIVLTYKVLKNNPDVLLKYQNKFKFIHVDEYQDTNRAQYLLIHLLASGHKNICVVGDEDQSIYKWRGADIRNILDFEKDYGEAKVLKLEQNYRSTKTIIEASSAVISNNESRKAKKLWTENDVGDAIRHYQLDDERSEAELVANFIKQLCESRFAYGDIAIFYRTNAQSRVLEDVLRREKISYKVIGGLRFFDRKEIKDVLAYFRILTNNADGISYKRIINVPQRSIGKTTVEKVEEYMLRNMCTFEKAIYDSIQYDGVGSAAKRKLHEFMGLVELLKHNAGKFGLSDFYHDLLDQTAYVKELKEEGTEESLARIENLHEFDSLLQDFEKELPSHLSNKSALELLPIFLESVVLVGEQDNKNEMVSELTGSVSMMTLHTSKGLEFPVVFMVGMEEGLFPSIRDNDNTQDQAENMEEERRLCYVGMTRARELLFLSSATCRRVYGNIIYHEPARFLNEIPDKFMQTQDLSSGYFKAKTENTYDDDTYESHGSGFYSQASSSETYSKDERIGKKVRHEVYGIGVVKAVEGVDDSAKVTVEFSNRNVKKFILKYAKLNYVV